MSHKTDEHLPATAEWVCRLCKVSQLQLVTPVASFRLIQQMLPGLIYRPIFMQRAFKLDTTEPHRLGQELRPHRHAFADIIQVQARQHALPFVGVASMIKGQGWPCLIDSNIASSGRL